MAQTCAQPVNFPTIPNHQAKINALSVRFLSAPSAKAHKFVFSVKMGSKYRK